MWPCNGGLAQQWKLGVNGSIVSALGSTSMCLEAGRDELDTATPLAQAQPVYIAACNGSLRQKWSIRGPITTIDRFGCVTAPGTTGAAVSQTACNGSADQILDLTW
jgi:hypothetical protein